jgi:hypothetical protein
VVSSAVLVVMTAGHGPNSRQGGPTLIEPLSAPVEEVRYRHSVVSGRPATCAPGRLGATRQTWPLVPGTTGCKKARAKVAVQWNSHGLARARRGDEQRGVRGAALVWVRNVQDFPLRKGPIPFS